jgi:Family of unknown function (DUF6529)
MATVAAPQIARRSNVWALLPLGVFALVALTVGVVARTQVAKVLIVEMKRFPVWVIPVAGGVLFTTLITIWYTSALWFFTTIDSGF